MSFALGCVGLDVMGFAEGEKLGLDVGPAVTGFVVEGDKLGLDVGPTVTGFDEGDMIGLDVGPAVTGFVDGDELGLLLAFLVNKS